MNPANPQNELPETKAPQLSPVSLAELQYHFEGLRSLVLLGLLGLIGVVLAVDLCFLRASMISVRTQLERQRDALSKLAAAHKQQVEPLATNFVANLQSFAASNQDFQPILDKYRLVLAPYLTPVPAVSPPSPSLEPQPK